MREYDQALEDRHYAYVTLPKANSEMERLSPLRKVKSSLAEYEEKELTKQMNHLKGQVYSESVR